MTPLENNLALALWGLAVDDFGVASNLHDTSTVKNDFSETGVVQKPLVHFNRTRGSLVSCVC